ncbi:MAG: hypothetical protein NDI77_06355 [Geobacteraceae bacterium]|nr:hypothetical protein [Geobacteraceae bacterium]
MISVVTKYCICLLIFLLLNTGIAIGSTEIPAEIVKRYCSADLNGARLSSNAYNAVRPLVYWNDEPGWDHSFVISGFDVIKSKKTTNGEVIVEVTYNVIAILNGDELLTYNFVELVDFVLAKKGKEWRIVRPIVPPHVSATAAIENITNVLKTETDKGRVRELKHLVDRLEGIKGKR